MTPIKGSYTSYYLRLSWGGAITSQMLPPAWEVLWFSKGVRIFGAWNFLCVFKYYTQNEI